MANKNLLAVLAEGDESNGKQW